MEILRLKYFSNISPPIPVLTVCYQPSFSPELFKKCFEIFQLIENEKK